MAGSSISLAVKNLTTIENLTRKTKVWQLAVRIPHTDVQPQAPYDASSASNRAPSSPRQLHSSPEQDTASNAANHVSDQSPFAVLKTRPGENPWDLGASENWKAVMGPSFLDWILPIRHSPCSNHDRGASAFAVGPVVQRMRREAGLIPKRSASQLYKTKGRQHRYRDSDDGYPQRRLKKHGRIMSSSDAHHRRKHRNNSRRSIQAQSER